MNEEKRTLRRQVLAAEKTMTRQEKAAADAAIRQHVLTLPSYRCARTVMAFVGKDDEIDTRPLLVDILASGKRLCVPLCVAAGEMECREIGSLDELQEGSYGIWEPPVTAPRVPPEDIDLVLVPCVTCDHDGHRLGRGGGYYDRFLSTYTGQTALLAREALTRDTIPQHPHDRIVKPVVTDSGVFG